MPRTDPLPVMGDQHNYKKNNTLVTKYTDTLTFNIAHTINPKWNIMPL